MPFTSVVYDSGKSKTRDFLESYALSSAAAAIAETATYPLDLTKTRLQIQGEHLHETVPCTSRSTAPLHHVKHGMMRTAYGIAKEEGVLQLWQGLPPAVVRHLIYSGARIGFYEHFRNHIFKRESDGTFLAWKSITSGMLAGAMAQFLASPSDLIKVQFQMEGKRRLLGHEPRFRGMVHAFTTILKSRGVRGLWKGVIPNCQRAALVNMADLATYDKVKYFLLTTTSLTDNYVTHGIASIAAGFAGAVVCTPADVIKTRIMNQPHDASGHNLLYKNSVDCFQKIVKVEGFLALYKGFMPLWMRLGPWCLIFWMSYEKIRRMTGLSGF